MRASGSLSLPRFHGVFLEKRVDAFILHPRPGGNAEHSAALDASLGTHKIRDQIVNVFDVHTCAKMTKRLNRWL